MKLLLLVKFIWFYIIYLIYIINAVLISLEKFYNINKNFLLQNCKILHMYIYIYIYM